MILQAALLVIAAVPLSPRPDPDPDPPDRTVIEFRLGRMDARVMPAYTRGDLLYLPVRDVLDFVEVWWEATPNGFTATFQPGKATARFDAARGELVVRNLRHPLDSLDYHHEGGQYFLATHLMALLLDVVIRVDQADLAAIVVDPGSLPIARRLARAAARRSLLTLDELHPDALVTVPRRSLNGMVLDYTVLNAGPGLGTNPALTGGLGLEVMGGAFDLRVATGRDARPRWDTGWTGVWRNQTWLRQIRLGDGEATGPHRRAVRGISLTNRPWVRPAMLGMVSFDGVLEAGWEVEAFRGGRLVDVVETDASGRFRLDAPIQYGENPLRFVAYGPFGQVREFTRALRLGAEQVPGGAFEYGVSGGACRGGVCRATANADLRYGISSRWVVGAGLDRFWRETEGDLTHPYALIAGHPTQSWFVRAEVVGDAVSRFTTAFEPTGEFRMSIEHTRFDTGVPAPILTPAGRERQWTVDATWRPGGGSRVAIDAIVDLAGTATGRELSGRLGSFLTTPLGQFMPHLRFLRIEGDAGTREDLATGIMAVLPPGTLPLLRTVGWHGNVEATRGQGITTASLHASRTLRRGTQVQTGVRWHRGTGPQLTLALSSLLTGVRAYLSTSASGDGIRSTSFLQGAVIGTPGEGWHASAAPGLARGGIRGRAFLDVNGNGHEDPGEPPLAGIAVRAELQTAVTGEDGTFFLWDLHPYEPTRLTVDTLTLASPLWVPDKRVLAVEPTPHATTPVALPIIPGGVIEGRVTARGHGVAGVRVTARHAASGEERQLVTFSDGGFYAMGIRPGIWELTARAANQAAALQFEMPVSRDGVEIRDLALVLGRRR